MFLFCQRHGSKWNVKQKHSNAKQLLHTKAVTRKVRKTWEGRKGKQRKDPYPNKTMPARGFKSAKKEKLRIVWSRLPSLPKSKDYKSYGFNFAKTERLNIVWFQVCQTSLPKKEMLTIVWIHVCQRGAARMVSSRPTNRDYKSYGVQTSPVTIFKSYVHLLQILPRQCDSTQTRRNRQRKKVMNNIINTSRLSPESVLNELTRLQHAR